jgi:hypothetical protein
MAHYRVWNGEDVAYLAWLTVVEVIRLRRDGYYVRLVS